MTNQQWSTPTWGTSPGQGASGGGPRTPTSVVVAIVVASALMFGLGVILLANHRNADSGGERPGAATTQPPTSSAPATDSPSATESTSESSAFETTTAPSETPSASAPEPKPGNLGGKTMPTESAGFKLTEGTAKVVDNQRFTYTKGTTSYVLFRYDSSSNRDGREERLVDTKKFPWGVCGSYPGSSLYYCFIWGKTDYGYFYSSGATHAEMQSVADHVAKALLG